MLQCFVIDCNRFKQQKQQVKRLETVIKGSLLEYRTHKRTVLCCLHVNTMTYIFFGFPQRGIVGQQIIDYIKDNICTIYSCQQIDFLK